MKNLLYSIAEPLRPTMAYFYESKFDDCANIWNDLHIYDDIPMIHRKEHQLATCNACVTAICCERVCWLLLKRTLHISCCA